MRLFPFGSFFFGVSVVPGESKASALVATFLVAFLATFLGAFLAAFLVAFLAAFLVAF